MRRALAELRAHPTRVGAVWLAIVIGVGFLTTTLVFVATETNAIQTEAIAPVSRADLVVGPDEGSSGLTAADAPALAEAVSSVPGVAEAVPVYSGYAMAGGTPLSFSSLSPESLRTDELTDGRWPASGGEVALQADYAAEAGVAVGGEIVVDGDPDAPAQPMRVVGLVAGGGGLLSGTGVRAITTSEWFTDAARADYSAALLAILATPGTDTDGLVPAVQSAVDGSGTGDGQLVQTRDDYAQALLKALAQGSDVLGGIALSFGAIALLVAMLIIANTFTILIAQRRRQIGLLRAVGAGTGQVSRGLLTEALVIAVIGSLSGVVVGIGVAAIAATVTGSIGSGLTVPPSVVAAALVGIAVTVAAAWVPSLRTSRIAPLEALRASADEQTSTRPGVLLTIVAALLVIAGAAQILLAVLSGQGQLLLAVGAGFAISLGVLLAAGWYVPALVGGLGRAAAAITRGSSAGVTTRLAAANGVRHPRRTTATCLALMLAVGLIATLQVGSATVKHSVESGIADRYPVPVVLTTLSEQPLPDDAAERVAALDGVTGVTSVLRGTAAIGESDEYSLTGLPAGAAELFDAPAVTDDELLVSPEQLGYSGWKAGQVLTLGKGADTVEVTVTASWLAAQGPVVSAATLQRVGSDVQPAEVWASTDVRDGPAGRALLAELDEIAGGQLYVTGALSTVVTLTTVLDTLLLVATALLGAAVLIALIGVGNTLGLSVLERTRESALLRALGLQRRQLRLLLAVEAVLLALTGAAVGLLAGVGLGYLGGWAVLSQMEQPALLAVSAPMLALDVGVAVVAGLLASVLPARRAARVAPAEALAEV